MTMVKMLVTPHSLISDSSQPTQLQSFREMYSLHSLLSLLLASAASLAGEISRYIHYVQRCDYFAGTIMKKDYFQHGFVDLGDEN